MNILTSYARKLIIEKLDQSISKIREVDEAIYSNKKLHDEWRLVRDAIIILEDLKNGINVKEDDNCDC